MRGVGAGSNYRQTKNRYITITSVSPDTLVDHTRHTGTKKLHTTYASPAETCVLVDECGKVFPAGVGPDSPSRNVANWLSSQLAGRLDAVAVRLVEDGVH